MRRTLFFPIRLESGSAWASRLIPSLIVQSWGWREQAAALSICTVTRRAFLLSWESSTPISVPNVVSQDDGSEMTKEIYELVLRSTMIVDRIVGPQERKKRAVKPQSLPERSEKTVGCCAGCAGSAGCASCHCEKRKNPPSPPCVEPPSPDLGCVLKRFSPLDVYAHYERSPAPPPCLILTSLAIVPSAWTIRRPPASSCYGRERRRN